LFIVASEAARLGGKNFPVPPTSVGLLLLLLAAPPAMALTLLALRSRLCMALAGAGLAGAKPCAALVRRPLSWRSMLALLDFRMADDTLPGDALLLFTALGLSKAPAETLGRLEVRRDGDPPGPAILGDRLLPPRLVPRRPLGDRVLRFKTLAFRICASCCCAFRAAVSSADLTIFVKFMAFARFGRIAGSSDCELFSPSSSRELSINPPDFDWELETRLYPYGAKDASLALRLAYALLLRRLAGS
jgi:hypothetical protein